MTETKNSNTGFYIVIGVSVLAIGGYLVYKNWYNQNIKDNKAVGIYNWINETF
jgi:hypothetical protein